MTIDLAGEQVILDPSGALFWKRKKALLVADVHLGKITHFRKNGIPVPREPILDFYRKMESLKQLYPIEKLYILGDLFHSSLNREWTIFEQWSKNQKCSMTLISGNHDILPSQAYANTPLEVVESLILSPFHLTHEPETHSKFTICGHIHPGILLRGKGRQSIKIGCFFRKPNQLILPAFGTFTGLHLMPIEEEDRVYILGENEVLSYRNSTG